ncbi:UNVERIFIED_ORG: hypothetical protein ABID33_001852 [Xanthobacter viscosus]|uniref:Uncharacterized protein n=1 Tax=Xanthobacter autotrophicus TaxID=280 RepID=A0A6C1KED1_XANAU|nr:hypothetical protein [Xanthobacter autotrophicus]TLX42629.1 hypothetical protein FBQ73_13405 [Xanthobacter autotrophicus]
MSKSWSIPIGEIQEKYFLSPREAIALIGPETHGSAWEDNLPFDDERIKIPLRNLYKALESGKVDAFYHAFDGHERQLKPAVAANEFFKIDLKRNCCLFGPIESHPYELKISKSDLVAFLSKHRRPSISTNASDLSKCFVWLLNLFTKHQEGTIGPSDKLFEAARIKFPSLSRRAFDDAKRRAVNESNRPDLRRGGRPKGSRKNQTGTPE